MSQFCWTIKDVINQSGMSESRCMQEYCNRDQ